MKKTMKNIICIICTLSVACTLYLWLPGLAPEVNAAGTGVSEGDWMMSDEKLEGSGYRFELSYQRTDGSVGYVYMTPSPSKGWYDDSSGLCFYLVAAIIHSSNVKDSRSASAVAHAMCMRTAAVLSRMNSS